MLMKTTYKPKKYEIAGGTNQLVFPEGTRVGGGQWRFSVVGAGTADIQPIFDGIDTHKPETVTNDSVVLDYSGVDNFRVTASSGDITVIFTGYGANC